MINKCLKRLDNIIKSSKKWHFFHFFIITSCYTFLIYFTISELIPFVLLNCNVNSLFRNYFFNKDKIWQIFSIYLFFAFNSFVFAFCLQLICGTINYIKYKNIQIKSVFLLKNKIYDVIYRFAFTYTTVSFLFLLIIIFYFLCLFIFAMYVISSGFSW